METVLNFVNQSSNKKEPIRKEFVLDCKRFPNKYLFFLILGGWWLGWAPLINIFATRISKGRTIKNLIQMAFIVPSFVNFVWFCVIGGLAIDMENRALNMQ